MKGWIKINDRLPEKQGYYVTVNLLTELSMLLPADRSDTYFRNGNFEGLEGWYVIEWLDETD